MPSTVIRRNYEAGQVSLDPLRWVSFRIGARTEKAGAARSTPNVRSSQSCRGIATPTVAVAASCRGRLLRSDAHNRMSLILAPSDYRRWLGNEPDPSDLMRPYPSVPMRTWPISTRVDKPVNDDPSVLEPKELASSAA